MSNIVISMKRFFSNKNTVTVIITFIIMGILLAFYNYTINEALREVNVVVAKTTIDPNTEITSSMYEIVKVPRKSIPDNVYYYAYEVDGNYSRINSVIPAGSYFFKEMVQTEETKKDIYKEKLDEGEIAYKFKVDVNSTYGNSIIVGEYINIYMKSEDSNGKILLGELLKDVEVIAVKDGAGNDIYQIAGTTGSPSYLYLAVEEDIHEMLLAAEFLSIYGVELFPVVTSESVNAEEGETLVSNETLQDYLKLLYDYYQSYDAQHEESEVVEEETTEEEGVE